MFTDRAPDHLRLYTIWISGFVMSSAGMTRLTYAIASEREDEESNMWVPLPQCWEE